MQLLPENSQKKLHGGYTNDCWWDCAAFINSGEIDQQLADCYAYNYFVNGSYQVSPSSLQDVGIRVSGEWLDAACSIGYSPDLEDNKEIRAYYVGNGMWHAVVYMGINDDGEHSYYDVSNNCYGTWTEEEYAATSYQGY